jgi:hypothetical protein
MTGVTLVAQTQRLAGDRLRGGSDPRSASDSSPVPFCTPGQGFFSLAEQISAIPIAALGLTQRLGENASARGWSGGTASRPRVYLQAAFVMVYGEVRISDRGV